MTWVGVVAFVVALLVSIMLHEAGHFVVARHFGMKATQFFVGFGPTLWSRRHGETEYGVKAIPAGGFVKIVGMTPLEEIEPGDEPRAFYNRPARQRALVMVAGSTVHFGIALVLLFVVLFAYPTTRVTTTIGQVQQCLTTSSTPGCPPGAPAAPAAGVLQPGDRVLAVNGHPVSDWQHDVADVVHAAGVTPVTFTVARGGRIMTITLTPAKVTVGGQTATLVGIAPQLTRQHLGLATAAGRTFTTFGSGVVDSFIALGAIPAQIPKLLNPPAHRTIGGSGSGLSSVVGVARLSGQALADVGLAPFLAIVASLNLFVGIFNLLPLLPFDGGHLAILGFEKARSGIAWVLRRPDPGRVDLTKLMPAMYLVLAVFVSLSVLLIYADIAHPISNPFQ